MNLSKEELNRMAFLLGKSKHLILDGKEDFELRVLISKEQECPLSFDKMIELGCIIVGAYTILETYEKLKEKIYKEENKIQYSTKNLIKIPVTYEYDRLDIRVKFNTDVELLQKYFKNGFIYIQILADDNTKPFVKERAEVEIDKMLATVKINLILETYNKFIRNGFIYVKICEE